VVDSVEGLSADDIPDLLPSLPKSQAEGSLFEDSLLHYESVKIQNILLMFYSYLGNRALIDRVIRFCLGIAQYCGPTIAAFGQV